MAADEITLIAETGRPTGSRASRRLRAEKKVPGVVYGVATEPTAIAVDWPDLRAALTTDAGLNALITLKVDGADKLTLIKDMQRHPIRRDVLHVDFIVIDRDTAVDVDVPVHLTGSPEDDTLVVDQIVYVLPISAKPGSIPNELVADISGLTLDTPVTVSDLDLPAGVEARLEADEPIVTASIQAVFVEPELEGAEDEAGEEGEEPAEGAEASDEGADDDEAPSED